MKSLLELMPVDELDDEERTELHRALEQSVAQMRAGQVVDASELLAKLRSRPPGDTFGAC